jgi:hypothetical protein
MEKTNDEGMAGRLNASIRRIRDDHKGDPAKESGGEPDGPERQTENPAAPDKK